MLRHRALLLAAAVNNKLYVALHTATGIIFFGASLSFSVMLALYFNYDVLHLAHSRWFSVLVTNKTYSISVAIVSALAALLARVTQVFVEAKVTSDQERWFAEQLRAAPAAKRVPGNIARASNYYGRLANASMRVVSSAAVITVNFIGLVIHLPPHYGTTGILLLTCCLASLYAVMKTLATKMTDSTSGLFRHIKDLSSWKLNKNQEMSEAIDQYFMAYRNRIFLASVYSFTPLLFALVFSIFILFMHLFNFSSFDLGQVFILFTLLKAYLGLVSNFFSSLVQSAAFIPAIKPYAAFIPGLELSPAEEKAIEAKYLIDDSELDSGSTDEI